MARTKTIQVPETTGTINMLGVEVDYEVIHATLEKREKDTKSGKVEYLSAFITVNMFFDAERPTALNIPVRNLTRVQGLSELIENLPTKAERDATRGKTDKPMDDAILAFFNRKSDTVVKRKLK